MKCPFLKEERVSWCRIAPVRKPIPSAALDSADGRCRTPEYAACPIAQGDDQLAQGCDRCPALQESLVQYCEAAAVKTRVPCNDDTFSRCNGEAHRYCVTYLQRVHPHALDRAPMHRGSGQGCLGRASIGNGIPVPERLAFSRNHMWIDVDSDGSFHIGVDAFLTRALGRVEGDCYLSEPGRQHPAAVLTIQGLDLPMAFPLRMNVIATNTLVRRRPEMLRDDPYGRGWLFEGLMDSSGPIGDARIPQHRNLTSNPPADSPADLPGFPPADPPAESLAGSRRHGCLLRGFLQGGAASRWMCEETERMSAFVHDLLTRRGDSGEVLAADGGIFAPDLAEHLQREELLRLYSLFFAQHID